MPVEAPELCFYRLYDCAQKPVLADESAHGLLPFRAYRFCEAARIASSVGWYVFPPVDFSVLFDGTAFFWRPDEDNPWHPLDDVVPIEDSNAFDSTCPEELMGHCPPFLGAVEGGILQLSTGLALRTNDGWGTLIRRPPNVPQRNLVEFFEGFVETSKWFGPLFINLKALKTDVELRFVRDWPVAFIQPVPVALMKMKLAGRDTYVSSLDEMSDRDWADLSDTLTNRLGPDRRVAKYARTVRRASQP